LLASPGTVAAWSIAIGVATLALAAACRPDPSTPAGIYHRQCARCHGVDGTGNRRAAKTMRGLDLTASEMIAAGDRAAIRDNLVHGEGSMPPFGEKLEPEQIDALVTYTLELAGRGPGFQNPPPP
jgi:mono/diheme cytochrome c family protein